MSINNELFTHDILVAAELFAAGWCNLDCSYCYIPKTAFIKDIHKDILNKIKNGKFLKELYDVFGESLVSISHWGTEPTLTLEYFKDFYNEAVNMFPKLEKVILSSNFMTNPKKLIDFVINLPEKLAIDIQISLDGPPEITDKNRRLGSTNTIINNVMEVFKELNKTNRKISAHFKPTLAQEDIKNFSQLEVVKIYYDFFDYVFGLLNDYISNIEFSKIVDPTIQVPGSYSKEDGKLFYLLYRNQLELQNTIEYKYISKPESSYFYRLLRIFKYNTEYYWKQHMFTCSSGDSSLALGEKDMALHWCHRTFYTDHDDYFVSAKDKGIIPSRLLSNTLSFHTLTTSDTLSKYKFLAKSRSFHDFAQHRENIAYAIILVLVKSGLINDIYKDNNMDRFLTILARNTDCYLDSAERYSSLFIPDSGIICLFGNGFGELLLKQFLIKGVLDEFK